MKIYQSKFGALLTLLYLCAAGFVVSQELPCRGGGWIDLCGLGIFIVTLPAALAGDFLHSTFGLREINFHQPALLDGVQVALYVLVCGLLVYFFGSGSEWLFRRLRLRHR